MQFFLWLSDSIIGTHLPQILFVPDMLAENLMKGIEKFEGISHAAGKESSIYPVEFVRQLVSSGPQ
jgi:hypothetical protein